MFTNPSEKSEEIMRCFTRFIRNERDVGLISDFKINELRLALQELPIRNQPEERAILDRIEEIEAKKRKDLQLFNFDNEVTMVNQKVVPALKETEKKKYVKEYPRKDTITFTDKEVGARSYEVLVNEHSVPVEYSLYGLLLFFAIALKKEKNKGWVALEDVLEEGLVRDQQHFHRAMGDLNKELERGNIEENKIKLVENLKRSGKYRISTMPTRIKTPLKWLSAMYKKLKPEILRERGRRDKNMERWKSSLKSSNNIDSMNV